MLLARRLSSSACALRSYTSTGGVEWSNTLYGAELAIHEALLSSPYRTLDPMAADWFYVPAYTGCFISEFNRPYPRHWFCSECHRKNGYADLATLRAMRSSVRILRAIRNVYPFWNRSGGADHIWPFMHDEGACYAPKVTSY